MAGTITSLSVQKNNRERVNVFLDGQYSFSLEIMAAALLRKGQWLRDEEIATLGRADEEKRAYLSAVRLLGVRPRSTREISQALKRRQFAEEATDAALQRLRDEGLLDDAEFARYWAENRSEFRPRSVAALRFELRQKGVDAENIDAAVGDVDDEAAAWDAAVRKMGTWQRLEPAMVEGKVLAFLARRGFSYATARHVWARLTGLLQEHGAQESPDAE